MAFGINKLKFIFQYIIVKLYCLNNGEDFALNINRNLLNLNQKKILLVYIPKVFRTDFSGNIYHPNLTHSLQMISVLIGKGYAIDVFHTKGLNSLKYIQREYDYIIGFGPVYEKAIESGIKGYPILLLTENDPRSVKLKYQERIDYYMERHSDRAYKKSRSRESFYTEKQLKLSKCCVAMNSSFNILNINELYRSLYKINVNGLYNPNFEFSNNDAVKNRNSFVWFGSNGCIHKGLDILVDVFAQLPEYTLSIYGLPKYELSIIKNRMTPNIHYCGSIDVFSEKFIDEVVKKHCFVISASCSEGMNSGIATCMRHGMIPVITLETGYEQSECIIELGDYHIDYLKEKLLSLKQLENSEIIKLSERAYHYGNKDFSLEAFTKRFSDIIDCIEKRNL